MQSNVPFGVGDTPYTSNAEVARNFIVDTYNWIISDGGLLSVPTAPSNVNTFLTMSFSINISWELPSTNGGLPITEYRVYKSTSTGEPYTHIATLTNSENLIKLEPDYWTSFYNRDLQGLTTTIVEMTVLIRHSKYL